MACNLGEFYTSHRNPKPPRGSVPHLPNIDCSGGNPSPIAIASVAPVARFALDTSAATTYLIATRGAGGASKRPNAPIDVATNPPPIACVVGGGIRPLFFILVLVVTDFLIARNSLYSLISLT